VFFLDDLKETLHTISAYKKNTLVSAKWLNAPEHNVQNVHTSSVDNKISGCKSSVNTLYVNISDNKIKTADEYVVEIDDYKHMQKADKAKSKSKSTSKGSRKSKDIAD